MLYTSIDQADDEASFPVPRPAFRHTASGQQKPGRGTGNEANDEVHLWQIKQR